jgi:hypothetical protein
VGSVERSGGRGAARGGAVACGQRNEGGSEVWGTEGGELVGGWGMGGTGKSTRDR